ncbi:103aa long hypothetical protein [Pyrococcus horikoshii OT3]|uniref:Uncharacterized protein n=1 Tax=Pyrococcus horikoshii (strain ATCC 700860 / DSM 12428 / JCM 9974 / NBRC 100139 / OT-3) TaxID=70601 RepID=O57815_PYRHO|nr:103aa long hypothetical protein [Pyrococcus horikoshii OT3]
MYGKASPVPFLYAIKAFAPCSLAFLYASLQSSPTRTIFPSAFSQSSSLKMGITSPFASPEGEWAITRRGEFDVVNSFSLNFKLPSTISHPIGDGRVRWYDFPS